MAGSTAKLSYSLVSKSVGVDYAINIPGFSSLKFVTLIGVGNLSGNVTLARPRTAVGDIHRFDQTFPFVRPLLVFSVDNFIFSSTHFYFAGGLLFRGIDSFSVSTSKELPADTDVTSRLPSTMTTLLILNAGIRF